MIKENRPRRSSDFGDYEVPVFGKTNQLLEEQIIKVEQEAMDNYEKNH